MDFSDDLKRLTGWLPSPLALRLELAANQREPGVRVPAAFQLLETAFKYVALTGLGRLKSIPPKLHQKLAELRRPATMGTWMQLMLDVEKALATRMPGKSGAQPVARPRLEVLLARVRQPTQAKRTLQQAFEALVACRNSAWHPRGGIEWTEALIASHHELLEAIAETLAAMPGLFDHELLAVGRLEARPTRVAVTFRRLVGTGILQQTTEDRRLDEGIFDQAVYIRTAPEQRLECVWPFLRAERDEVLLLEQVTGGRALYSSPSEHEFVESSDQDVIRALRERVPALFPEDGPATTPEESQLHQWGAQAGSARSSAPVRRDREPAAVSSGSGSSMVVSTAPARRPKTSSAGVPASASLFLLAGGALAVWFVVKSPRPGVSRDAPVPAPALELETAPTPSEYVRALTVSVGQTRWMLPLVRPLRALRGVTATSFEAEAGPGMTLLLYACTVDHTWSDHRDRVSDAIVSSSAGEFTIDGTTGNQSFRETCVPHNTAGHVCARLIFEPARRAQAEAFFKMVPAPAERL